MTTSSTNLNLTLYNNSTDQSGSFITWAQNMSGSSASNMTKIDSFAGSVSGSITTLTSNISGSMSRISASMITITGSQANISGSIAALNLRLMKLYEFSGAGLLDFNNIPQTYTHLLILGVAAANYVSDMDVGVDFNGDANNSNYIEVQWQRSLTPSNFEYIAASLDAQVVIGNIPGAAAGYGAPIMAIIPNYSASSGGLYKTGMGMSAFGLTTGYMVIGNQGGVWKITDPITRIRMFASAKSSVRYPFIAGTKISIYGL
jgi:hypothetical protein